MRNLKCKNKGFTLTELLVTVVILGIIMGISIPLIKNIRNNNENKKYDTYADSLLSGAKLYNDAYGEDLFGNKKNGCNYIKYSELATKDLVKDIQIDGVSCNNDNTYVRVIKIGDKYSYKPFLTCYSGENLVKSRPYDSPYPIDYANCDGIDGSNINVEVVELDEKNEITKSYDIYDKKERTVAVKLESFLGVDTDNISVDYQWELLNEESQNYEPVGNIAKVSFKSMSREQQEKKLLSGKGIVKIMSNNILTPEGLSGRVRLHLQFNKMTDLYGESSRSEKDFISRDYYIDNENPQVVVKSLDSKNGNDKKLIVKFDVSDKYTTNFNDFEICGAIGNNVTKCSDYKKLKKKELELDYSKYEGKEIVVNVFAKDLAANIGKGASKYRTPKVYTLTYKVEGGTECSPSKKEVSAVSGDGTTWGDLCKTTQDYKQFVGWYTTKDSSGDLVTKDTPVTKNMTVYARWRDSKVIFRFQTQSGDVLTPQTVSTTGKNYNWTVNSADGKYYYIYRSINGGTSELYRVEVAANAKKVTLPKYNNINELNITKGGLVAYSGKEWKCVSGCKTNGQVFKAGDNIIDAKNICDAKKGDCYATLKVNWNENKVNIKLNVGKEATLVSGKNGYSIDTNGNVLKSGGKVIHEMSYGGKLTAQGLLNYNSANYLSVKRNGYSVPVGSEWTDGNGKYYNQDTVYNASDFCDASASNCEVTLKLNWQKNPATYKVKYNLNGGSGTFQEQTKTENVNLTLYSAVPTKTGYTFDGWKATDGTKYLAGGVYSKNQATTLTAQWVAIAATYKVKYNLNGGSGTFQEQTKTENVALTLHSGKPTKSNSTFVGWKATDGTMYNAGASYTANSATTLTAQWKAKSTDPYTCNNDTEVASGIVCRRASKLHHDECNVKYSEAAGHCKAAGYTTSGSRKTKTIIYGKCGTSGVLGAGDAFDCDVNKDGKFDSDNERFYYVTDYFNPNTKSYESDTAVLIYSKNLGKSTYTGSVSLLPKTSQWKNVSLKNTNRTRYAVEHENFYAESSSSFNYSGRAARLLTLHEVSHSGCIGNVAGIINRKWLNEGRLDSCNHFLENTEYSNHSYEQEYWTENYRLEGGSGFLAWIISSGSRSEFQENSSRGDVGVRPVIEVPKTKIAY